jgi:hypothetical protein
MCSVTEHKGGLPTVTFGTNSPFPTGYGTSICWGRSTVLKSLADRQILNQARLSYSFEEAATRVEPRVAKAIIDMNDLKR